MLRDRLELAALENNLASLLIETGDLSAADSHIQRSLKLFAEVDIELGKAGALLTLTELRLRQGRLNEANAAAKDAQDSARQSQQPIYEAESSMWLGRIAAQAGDNRAALKHFASGLDQLAGLGLPERVVRAHRVVGDYYASRNDPAKAAQHYRLALEATDPAANKQTAAARSRTA
jgi:tetratricopeptide (TPR) repeat protein